MYLNGVIYLLQIVFLTIPDLVRPCAHISVVSDCDKGHSVHGDTDHTLGVQRGHQLFRCGREVSQVRVPLVQVAGDVGA